MEMQRSVKTRSLGINTTVQTGSGAPRTPSIGGHNQPTPSAARLQLSSPQHPEHEVKSAISSGRGSRINSRKSSLSGPREPPTLDSLRRGSLVGRDHNTTFSDGPPLLKVVVAGNQCVGKSSFIAHALDITKPLSSRTVSGRIALDTMVYRISLVELHLDQIEIEDGCHLSWPTYVDETPFSSPDAVICMYDASQPQSTTNIPRFLAALSNLDMPTLLLNSKHDPPDDDRDDEDHHNSTFTDQVKRSFPDVMVCTTSRSSRNQAKHSMFLAVKTALSDSAISSADSPSTPRPRTFFDDRGEATTEDDIQSSQRLARDSEAQPNIEDYALASVPGSDALQALARSSHGSRSDAQVALNVSTGKFSNLSSEPSEPQTPLSEMEAFSFNSASAPDTPFSGVAQTPDSSHSAELRRPGTADSQRYQTFFTNDDSPVEPSTNASVILKQRGNDDESIESGISFSVLVNRLLNIPNTRSDAKFISSFLCLYRAFTTPSRLLVEIVGHFMRTEKSSTVRFSKVAQQLGYLQVIGRWTAEYPGDFAGETVRDLATTFLDSIIDVKSFAPAAKEISNNLQVTVEDEDLGWAYRSRHTQKGKSQTDLEPSIDKSSVISGESQDTSSETEDESSVTTSLHSGTTSRKASIARQTLPTSQSATNLVALESARDEARKLRRTARVSLTNLQWRFFLDSPSTDIAREITRIDWTMYAAIRPRDFISYVHISEDKTRNTGLGMMARHFNRLKWFVSGMILLRDKPKHRAKMIEKWMQVGWKVRQMNNYNSLAAIVAGVNSSEVTRLSQTFELVPGEEQKQFKRLDVLMSPTKSYATYRMAWDNTSSERIPCLVVLLRDLRSTLHSNKTFARDKKINWKKFEIIGETIIGIQKTHEQPYSFPERTLKEQEISRMFLETKVVEDEDSIDPEEELYQRSLLIEPLVGVSESRKKFDWLRRQP